MARCEHKLVEILRKHGAIADMVARWCRVCGAVVVDGEADGRVAPGRYMPMTRPACSPLIDAALTAPQEPQ